MIATILIDNITKSDLIPEWGLAVYMEHNGHHFLLDTGTTGKFVENAKTMNLDIRRIEFAVLSHAHYDHSDGMAEFFDNNDQAKFYIRAGAQENCYDRREETPRYIGIHPGYLTTYQDRIIYVQGDYEVLPGVTLIPHKTPNLHQLGKKVGMYIKQNGRWYPDSFLHEQSLVIETHQGLVILNSCSHGGADNIIQEIQDTYPDKNIYAYIGGLHLFRSTEEEIRNFAARVKKTGIQKIYTGHCTGQPAFEILREELENTVEQIYTGLKIEVN